MDTTLGSNERVYEMGASTLTSGKHERVDAIDGAYVATITFTSRPCATEAMALAAARQLAAPQHAATDVDMAPPAQKKRKRTADHDPMDFADSAALLREYAHRQGKSLAFDFSHKEGVGHKCVATVGGVKHWGAAKQSKASAQLDAADEFFASLSGCEPRTRTRAFLHFAWRRGDDAPKDAVECFSAMRNYLRTSREDGMAKKRAAPDVGLTAAECRALLATHVSGKFASVLGRVARVAVAQGSQAGPDGAPWSSGGLDGKKNTLGDHEWGLFAVLDDGSGRASKNESPSKGAAARSRGGAAGGSSRGAAASSGTAASGAAGAGAAASGASGAAASRAASAASGGDGPNRRR
ncbi:hypothetical protein JL722_2402 [Aureococcus anophagefferens]|nr:hypothetical protein JL722_2402 [Aureococcus anophagefferens]